MTLYPFFKCQPRRRLMIEDSADTLASGVQGMKSESFQTAAITGFAVARERLSGKACLTTLPERNRLVSKVVWQQSLTHVGHLYMSRKQVAP
jgi:hypothetical protein